MAIIIDRDNKDTNFQELVEQLKQMLGHKSASKAVKEAVRFYVVDRPEREQQQQKIWEDLETNQRKLNNLRHVLQQRQHINEAINEFILEE